MYWAAAILLILSLPQTLKHRVAKIQAFEITVLLGNISAP